MAGTTKSTPGELKVPETVRVPLKIPVFTPVSVAVPTSPGKGSELERARNWTVSTVVGEPLAGSLFTFGSLMVTESVWSQS